MTLSEEKELWGTLLAHPMWKKLTEVADEQIKMRANTIIYTALPKLEDALGEQYMKGEINGMSTLLRLPETLVEQLTLEIKEMKEKQNGN